MHSKQLGIYAGVWLALGAVGCSDDDARSTTVPWADQRTQVIDTDRNIEDVPTPVGNDACAEFSGSADVCIQPQDECDGEAADVIVNDEGELLDIICYPAEDTLSVEEIEEADGLVRQNQNNSVILLDGDDDGVDLADGLSVDANNVIVYGEGPESSVIAGEVTIDGNNAIVRGVRIQGDVNIIKNDVVFSLCVIEGNLTVAANNFRMSGCDVLGEVSVVGNGTELYGNRFGSGVVNEGKNTSCDDNVSVVDSDADLSFSDEELAAAEDYGCGD